MTSKDVIKLAKEKEVKIVDLKLCDILGTWQHFAVPLSELKEEIFTEGLGFDGSSVRGWKAINASDMLVVPDPVTAFIDPFAANTTLSISCDVIDPITREPYNRKTSKKCVSMRDYSLRVKYFSRMAARPLNVSRSQTLQLREHNNPHHWLTGVSPALSMTKPE